MKKTLISVLIVILMIPVALWVGGTLYRERDAWTSSFQLSNALRNARSVTFVEFAPAKSGVFVLSRKRATPKEIAQFRSATGPWFLPFEPTGALCHEPHHYVEIVRADGAKLTFFVCFLCRNFSFDPSDPNAGSAFDLPPSWQKSLSSFFASVGMAPKTQDEYSAFYGRDSNEQEVTSQP